MTISELFDALGRARLAKRLGVGAPSLSNAVAAGRMPASWFFVVSELAQEAGVDCPVTLFAMKGLPLESARSPGLCDAEGLLPVSENVIAPEKDQGAAE